VSWARDPARFHPQTPYLLGNPPFSNCLWNIRPVRTTVKALVDNNHLEHWLEMFDPEVLP